MDQDQDQDRERECDRRLIRLGPILEIIQTIIWTGRLESESPVSACLVAESQSAKSACLSYFSETSTLKLLTDVTSRGLINQIRLVELRHLRHIVIMDLHMVVSHNRYTADRTLLTLGGMMEEGLAGIADAGGEQSFEGLPKIGVLMAVTPGFFSERRGQWRKTGFLSRFLCISYSYSDGTKSEIHDAIQHGHSLPDPKNIKLPQEGQQVTIPDDCAEAIRQLAVTWGTAQHDPAFRIHRQLRRLVKARALIDNRHTANHEDVVKVGGWLKFFDPLRPVEL